ncbi:hypothetical protein [Mycolicibacterium fluoranthenivorans]|uniref:hypothetical protein n=1 Tax=Mycolicibacterium fluoranthenivorans TaxID=258505 RepID=UPI001C9B7617|nr:hypothetical protein [Mycolicibacterium fluoranthenivorans]
MATWSDLASETISSLVNRPKGGIGTVRAIMIAAREAVATARRTTDAGVDAAAATRRLLDRLTDYDYTVLTARGWALHPQTIPVTAAQLGVAPVNVQRNQPRAYRRFRELLAEPAHAAVVDYAEDLRRRLGPLTRTHIAEHALKDLGLDLRSDAGQMLLHLAGPYSYKDTWLENADADGLAIACAALDAALTRAGAPTTTALIAEFGSLGIPEHITLEFLDSRPDLRRFGDKSVRWGPTIACPALDAAFERAGAPTTTALIAEFGNFGIPEHITIEFLDSRPDLRRFGDKWVRWGPTIAERIEAALHLIGIPASAATITATIGENCHPKSVREVLYEDSRFIRATKETWALRQWDIDEYTGVFSEIAARIDAAGGAISTKALVDDMTAAIPDIAETSIRTYLSAPGFLVENGMVRQRTAPDGWPVVAPLNAVRGAFHNGRNEIRIALPVTFDLLRGSGQTVNPAVATALGVHPGEQRSFTGPLAEINLSWRLSAITGATVGSLRAPAAALGAQLGDTIVLAFNLRDNTIDVMASPADADLRQRLRVLLGKSVRNPVAALARALNCPAEEVTALLTRRGDKELLALLTESAL